MCRTNDFEQCSNWLPTLHIFTLLSNPILNSHFTWYIVWFTFFCKLGQIMTSYDLLYGTDEWFWAMFALDWSKIELHRSSFFVDLSHELEIITYYWCIICHCRCLDVCSTGSKDGAFTRILQADLCKWL